MILSAICSMALAVYLCFQNHIGLWIIGQFVLSISIWKWFLLLQKFGHGTEIHSHLLNMLGGHVASFFCLVPFNQWRFLNSEKIKNGPKAISIQKKFLPPLNVLAYSVKNYWNIKKLFGLFPDKKIRAQFILSMLVMNCFFMLLMPSIPGFLGKFGIGYFIFLLITEYTLMKEAQA